jgi:hypothetical protein
MALTDSQVFRQDDRYGGPAQSATSFHLLGRAALVITDPQVDFLSPGASSTICASAGSSTR